MIRIRKYSKQDWEQLWKILEPVFREGDTYAVHQDVSEGEAHHTWIEEPLAVYVAEWDDGGIIGTYYLKPNQAGGGSHVCNCGYVVAENNRRKGIASEMCRHSQVEAVSFGFHAMQFNLVVSTNTGAVRLWQTHGFEIVGRLPEAFEHPRDGFVDAFVMYKLL